MTNMGSRSHGKSKQRQCAWCAHGIAENRPVFLLSPVGGHIVGPFHAGCAERIVLLARKRREIPEVPGATNYGTVLDAREETLPW